MVTGQSYPIKFTAKGLCDALDASMAFPGACLSMQNVIFDQSNPELVVARPGVGLPFTSFSGFITPTFISVFVVIGTVVYGMIATGRTAGHDEPFAYDTATSSFITISGVTAGNVPVTQPTAGDWKPPVMAMIGIDIVVAHVGFSGVGTNFVGKLDLTNPLAPVWSSFNTAPFALTAVPIAVANFGNRAYYAIENTAFFSDPLIPTAMTNAGQSLTLGDTTPIVGFCGLPIQTTSSGVVGALLAFKEFQIWQITGDFAVTGSLALNFLTLTTGTNSPRSVVQTPTGVIFLGIDGPYYVSAYGQILPLTNDFNKLVQDVRQPFQNIRNPTRAAASFTGAIYRICVDTVILGVETTNDYWYDLTVRRWNGPHTFNYDEIAQLGNEFVISSRTLGAFLFFSQWLPDLTSVYNDNGTPLSVNLQSSFYPKTPNINEKQVIETTIELASQSASLAYIINAYDENFNLIGTATINVVSPLPIWGSGILWGAFDWASGTDTPLTYAVPWPEPLVFKKLSLQILAVSAANAAIGTSFSKYKDNGYTVLYANILPILPLPFPTPIVWDGGERWDDGSIWL